MITDLLLIKCFETRFWDTINVSHKPPFKRQKTTVSKANCQKLSFFEFRYYEIVCHNLRFWDSAISEEPSSSFGQNYQPKPTNTNPG